MPAHQLVRWQLPLPRATSSALHTGTFWCKSPEAELPGLPAAAAANARSATAAKQGRWRWVHCLPTAEQQEDASSCPCRRFRASFPASGLSPGRMLLLCKATGEGGVPTSQAGIACRALDKLGSGMSACHWPRLAAATFTCHLSSQQCKPGGGSLCNRQTMVPSRAAVH